MQGKTSHCYRIAYRSPDRSMTDEEINLLQVGFACHVSVVNGL